MIKKIIDKFKGLPRTFASPKIASKQGFLDEVARRQDFNAFSSVLKSLPNPDIILKKQGKNLSIYRELSYDPHVFACIQSRKSGITSKKWQLEVGNSSDDVLNFVEEVFDRLDITDILNGILDAPFYGYQPMEIMWELKDGLIMPYDVVAKPPEWFNFDSDGELCLRKFGETKGSKLPQSDMKFLLPRSYPTYFNPYGEAVFARIFWSVVFKKGGLKFWATFTEKYGMPFIVGTYNKGQAPDEVDSLADMLENMVQDAVAVIPNDSSVEIKEATAKSSSSNIYQDFLACCDANISKAILGQTLTTEAGNSGSYALGNVHNEVRQDIIMSDVRICEEVLNKLIHWIVLINKGDVDCPKFKLYDEEGTNLELANRDKTLAEILEKDGRHFSDAYLMRTYNLTEEDIVKSAPTKPPKTFAEELNENSIKLPPVDDLDTLIKDLDNTNIQKQIDGLLTPVLKLIDESQDPQTVLDKLSDTYPDMDIKELEELLTKAIFISEIWGRING